MTKFEVIGLVVEKKKTSHIGEEGAAISHDHRKWFYWSTSTKGLQESEQGIFKAKVVAGMAAKKTSFTWMG